MDSTLAVYVKARVAEFSSIPDRRKVELEKIADFVRSHRDSAMPARITFICTHNSRRSHMAQIWAHAAAAYFGIDGVETYSGGTEATAFNPRAVRAIERAGFRVAKKDERTNPVYEVYAGKNMAPSTCFSKRFDDAANPSEDFCAVMTCSQADETCPFVAGATKRVSIPYEDPKASDGTSQEDQTYDARCAQIAREMLFAFSRVRG